MRRPWAIRGSRLLRHFLVGRGAETNIARSPDTCQRAPLQALATNNPCQRANPFEEDDEDDYDYEVPRGPTIPFANPSTPSGPTPVRVLLPQGYPLKR